MKTKKRELSNPARFWVGAIMGLVEIVGMMIYFLSKVDYSWITEQLVLTAFSISAIVMYNIVAVMLVLNGSKR